MRKLFNASSKTPVEFLYMETGKIPIRYILKSRRLMFWYDIVNRDEKSLLHKFYKAQKIKTVKNDWIEQLEKDKIDLEIDLDDKTVKQYSKRKFKKYVKTKIMDATAVESLKFKCYNKIIPE